MFFTLYFTRFVLSLTINKKNRNMSGEDLQRQTSINIQEKANLIWAIADKLVR